MGKDEEKCRMKKEKMNWIKKWINNHIHKKKNRKEKCYGVLHKITDWILDDDLKNGSAEDE